MNIRHINRKQVVVATVAVVFVVGVVVVCLPNPKPEIQGNLSSRDISEVSQIVRTTMRQAEPLLPDLSWDSIRWLPAAIRQRWSEQIVSIRAETNASVEVRTGTDHTVATASTYRLKKSSEGWQIVQIDSVGSFVAQPAASP